MNTLQKSINKVGIIILNWNNYHDTKKCINSIKKLEYSNWFCIIVDNDSKDDSYYKLKMEFPRLTFLKNKRNLGYAGGYNKGIKEALSKDCKYVFLVNNDITMHPQSLRLLVSYMENNEEIGVIGGKIYFMNDPNIIWSAGGKIYWHKAKFTGRGLKESDIGQYDREAEVNYLPGAAVLIRTAILKKIGLLPECYFLGGEEADFCVNVKKEGYKNFYIPTAIFWHKVGYSGQVLPKYQYNRVRNRLMFVERNFPYLLKKLWHFIYLARYIILKIIAILTKNPIYKKKDIIRKNALKDHKTKTKIEESELERIEMIICNL